MKKRTEGKKRRMKIKEFMKTRKLKKKRGLETNSQKTVIKMKQIEH